MPYGVKVNVIYSNENASSFKQRVCVKGDNELNTDIIWLYQHNEIGIKPYLFPLSSVTEEQQIDLTKFVANGISGENIVYDWYNKNHFDYRGLIPKGLAIDATGLNIY